jgi:hypothetical protein
MKIKISVFLLIFFQTINLYAQKLYSNEDKLKKTLYGLADDKMAGREAGTEYEFKAAGYIVEILCSYGYKPVFNNNPLVKFKLAKGRNSGNNSILEINGKGFIINKDFFVPPFSSSSNVSGRLSTVPEAESVLLLKSSTDSIRLKIASLRDQGVKSLIYYSGSELDTLKYMETAPTSIPVIQVTEECAKLLQEALGSNIHIYTDVKSYDLVSNDVLMSKKGRLDKPYILIGAHYDHLGFGGEGSMKRGITAIHNGADDNASGVSAMMEIARILRNNDKGIYDIVFVAFGAEEKGLAGSGFLADTLKRLGRLPALMINLDMVGRLVDNKLQISGVGTFKGADSLLKNVNQQFNFTLLTTKDGYGPSDQSSFVSMGIPVLYFTTGVHSDYHTPDDDPGKINYSGLKMITDFVASLSRDLSMSGMKMDYINLPPPSSMGRKSLKVTLGLIPDFTYDVGDGFKVGPVTEGKPAAMAGLKAGDIITAINSKKVNNVYEYMSRLSELKSGDKIVLDVRRNGKELKLIVQL